jgi:hypothetical protein
MTFAYMRDDAAANSELLPSATTDEEIHMLCSRYARTALIASVASLALAGTAFAQTQTATPAQPGTPGYSSSATQMPSVIPSKSETASSAFEKLDASHAGSLSREQTAKLDGFDAAFVQADKDKDGKLSRDEFQAAWAIYTRG